MASKTGSVLVESQKVIRTPLVGTMNQRGIDGLTNLVTLSKDQRFQGLFFNIVDNPVTNTKTVFAEKRPGFVSRATVESGSYGAAISADHLLTIFNNAGTYTVYYNDIKSCGTMTDVPVWVRKVNIGNEFYYMISGNAPGGYGYFVPVNATDISTSYTGDTHSNTTIDDVQPSTSGMYVGQIITGTDIPAGTRIATITSSSAITITQAATGTTNDLALTRTHLAKIIDADFPTKAVGPFVDIDGYLVIADTNGFLWNGDLNSVVSWDSLSFLRAQIRPDTGVGLFKQKNRIGYLGSLHIEFFGHPGTQASGGSILQATKEYFEIGAAGSELSFGDLLSEAGDSLDAESADNLITEGNAAAIPSYDFIGDDIFFNGLVGGQFGVWMVRDLQIKQLSGPSQDYIFSSSGVTQSIEAMALPSGIYVHVHNGNSYSLIYHVDTGIWGETAFPAGFMVSHDGHAISTASTTGKRYQLDFGSGAVFTDDGSSYSAIIQTARRDYESGNRKFINYYEIDCDRQSGGTATLEVSDDDGQTWAIVGTFDMTRDHPRIWNGGSFEGGRQERITHSAATAFRASLLSSRVVLGDN